MAGTFKLLQNLAGLIGGALVLAFGIDWAAKALGYRTALFCWALRPMVQVAYILGYCLTVVGIMLWIFTFLRNSAASCSCSCRPSSPITPASAAAPIWRRLPATRRAGRL